MKTINNFWFYISMGEFICILLLLKSHKRDLTKNDELNIKLKDYKNSTVNMGDIMDDLNKSKELYKKIAKAIHPDRFTDELQKEKADLLFQETTKDKNNYKSLLLITKKIKNELSIVI